MDATRKNPISNSNPLGWRTSQKRYSYFPLGLALCTNCLTVHRIFSMGYPPDDYGEASMTIRSNSDRYSPMAQSGLHRDPRS